MLWRVPRVIYSFSFNPRPNFITIVTYITFCLLEYIPQMFSKRLLETINIFMESKLSALSAYLLAHSSQLNQENLLAYLFLRGLVLTNLVLLRLSSSLLTQADPNITDETK